MNGNANTRNTNMNEQMLDISKIRIDGDTQPRLAIDQVVVADYADLLESGTNFPPVQVVSDGAVHWLVDGFHRYFAHRKLGRKHIKAEVTTGLLEEAQWLSLTANKAHGLRRTNNDKAKAVIKALKMKPQLSDSAIAEHIGVNDKTVAKYRESIANARKLREGHSTAPKAAGSEIPNLVRRVGRDGKKYPARSNAKPAIPPHTPIRSTSPVDDRRHIGMSKDPAMGARALFEFFDRLYLETLVAELQALLAGTAGPPPSLRDIPQALSR